MSSGKWDLDVYPTSTRTNKISKIRISITCDVNTLSISKFFFFSLESFERFSRVGYHYIYFFFKFSVIKKINVAGNTLYFADRFNIQF